MIVFDRQPTLAGALLELRPLRPEDWGPLFAVASDPLLWAQHPSSDRYKEDVFRRLFEEGLNSGGALAAVERASGEIVGSSRYHGFDAEQSVVEIGWSFLARRCWGGTYNGEMKRLMLEHAFNAVARVILIIGPDNHRSRRAVEKIGAVYVGTAHIRGRESVVYELTKSAFATGPLSVAAGAQSRDNGPPIATPSRRLP